jgi:hypothetical protein
MTGKLKTKGNMMLAAKLDGVLKVRRERYQLSEGQICGSNSPLPSFFRLPRPRLSSKRETSLNS